jgi:hypothetical protein
MIHYQLIQLGRRCLADAKPENSLTTLRLSHEKRAATTA